MKKNVSLIVAIVLGALLLVAVGYILFGVYSNAKAQEQIEVYQAGYNYGMNYTLTYIMQQAGSCQTIPLTDADNQTITLFAYECLTQAQNATK
jgi:type II secretory pathway pseudopilin PulG